MNRENLIEDAIKNYLEEERELEKKLNECENVRCELKSRGNSMIHEKYDSMPKLNLNREASQFRNRQLLQDLEKSKARLRTFSAFTPTDQELRDIAIFYRSLLAKAGKN